MVEVFFLDKDKYLNGGVLPKKCMYTGKFNSQPPTHKHAIIDLLVSRVKYGTVGSDKLNDAMIGLVLIFEATFKALNTRFIETLELQFGYSSDEFMNILILHMYEMIKGDYKCKHEGGFRANFNRYISSKLQSKALCILSKEKIYRKYKDKLIDAHIAETTQDDGMGKMLFKMQFASIRKLVEQDLRAVKDVEARDICQLFLSGYELHSIVDRLAEDRLAVEMKARKKAGRTMRGMSASKFKPSIKKVNRVLRDFKLRCRGYFAEMEHYIKGDDDV